jgi:hypothetical protein
LRSSGVGDAEEDEDPEGGEVGLEVEDEGMGMGDELDKTEGLEPSADVRNWRAPMLI